MDQLQILAQITAALSALHDTPEHRVLDYELHNVDTPDFSAEVHIKGGRLAFFAFTSQEEKDAQQRMAVARDRLYRDR